ncbi:hypothetical protein [Sulfoacidibacillus thermotolerans]|uniref:Uncharacterized protein n=1 Tax=Sulfoacidibacillus thermotolerans TaxID=1765684 RepID=A0A2U3D5L1_SULT2|nr:hypothetical protein [Sulfoacidibacillus thermotolerans]PWI56565.1 hypothetical protein BM613_13030 [Sulfoacidibacillus thermotolerans]
MEEQFNILFMTLFVSAMLEIAGFFGIRMDEAHIAQMAAQNAARTAAVTPSTSAVDQAALKTIQASGAPVTWDGKPTLTDSDVAISQNGNLITATVHYQAPVVFPQLLSWLGIQAGPTMPITAKATYYNEWGTGDSSSFTPSTQTSGTNGITSPSSTSFQVTLATTEPQTTDTTFLNGQPITLTATSNNDVSLAQGDALQIYDETTGQWIGAPVFSGTTDSVTVSGTNETDTFEAVIAPWGTTSGELAQSNTLTDTWEATPTDSQLQIEASANNGATWWQNTNNGNDWVWNEEPVLLQASLKGLYLPSGYTLSVEDETTNQIVDTGSDESSLETTVQNNASKHSYAAVLQYNGQTYSTQSTQDGDVSVNWNANNSLTLSDSYLSNGEVAFTATANFPMQSGTANGPYTDYMYLYNESLSQWEQIQGVTGDQTQASWTLPAGSDSGDQFVAYLESTTTPTAGTYPQSAAQPPLESNSLEIPVAYTVSLTAQGNDYNNDITLTASLNQPLRPPYSLIILERSQGDLLIAGASSGSSVSVEGTADTGDVHVYDSQDVAAFRAMVVKWPNDDPATWVNPSVIDAFYYAPHAQTKYFDCYIPGHSKTTGVIAKSQTVFAMPGSLTETYQMRYEQTGTYEVYEQTGTREVYEQIGTQTENVQVGTEQVQVGTRTISYSVPHTTCTATWYAGHWSGGGYWQKGGYWDQTTHQWVNTGHWVHGGSWIAGHYGPPYHYTTTYTTEYKTVPVYNTEPVYQQETVPVYGDVSQPVYGYVEQPTYGYVDVPVTEWVPVKLFRSVDEPVVGGLLYVEQIH